MRQALKLLNIFEGELLDNKIATQESHPMDKDYMDYINVAHIIILLI